MPQKYYIFVDVDSLNVLYKCGDKFVAALGYGAGIERLGETLPALGTGYDIYLCMKPRAPGEADLVIDELSIPGLPFTVDSEELYQLLKYFRDYQGFGEVYLCNWVYNYIQMARVQTFKSVVYYGNRVAMIAVKDSVLEKFKVYNSQREFEDTDGRNFTGYGDVGLIDIDGFKAQYPEFAEGTKPQLTAVAPLAHCYRTSLRLETGELFERLKASRASGERLRNTFVERSRKEPEPVDDPNLRPTKFEPEGPDIPEELEVEERPVRRRAPVPIVTKLLVATSCILAVSFGAVAGVVMKDPGPTDYSSYFNQVQEQVQRIQSMQSVYADAPYFVTSTAAALEYCKTSPVSVSVLGFEHQEDYYIVRYACASNEVAQQYLEHIEAEYAIHSTNSLGQSEIGGQTVYQFVITFG